MCFDSEIVMAIVGGAIGSFTTLLLLAWSYKLRIKKLLKKLKPDPIEKQRAIELIEKQTDKVKYLEELMLNYAKINFEAEIRRSPIFVSFLFRELNKYLSTQNQPIDAKKLEHIKLIIKDESDTFTFYEILKNFLICLILDIDFDYKKYRDLFVEIYGYKK
ncbi:hypothetical protein COBT_001295 [Conglomerata obtusa]